MCNVFDHTEYTFILPCYHSEFQQTETKLFEENFILSKHERERDDVPFEKRF